MYSEELEEIIEGALVDGVLTDKERAVLHRRAIAEGVDVDELDIVLEGRLAKRKKELDAMVPPPFPGSGIPTASAADGRTRRAGYVRKCPACGASIGGADVKCEECGHELVGVAANSSREKLNDMIAEINKRYSKKSGVFDFFNNLVYSKDEEIKLAITTFPVPNTKEDLLEFLLFLEPLAATKLFSGDYNPYYTPAYKKKYQECRKKAELFFADDPMFRKVLSKK